LKHSIDKLQSSYFKNKYTRKEEIFIGHIINTLDKTFFLNLCLVHFLLVYTYQNSDQNLLGVSINIGNKILNKYFNVLMF